MKFLKISLFLISIVWIFAFLSCSSVNVNQPSSTSDNSNIVARPAETPAAIVTPREQFHWSVVICSSRARNVTLSAGTSDTDSEVFAIWKKDAPERVFELPANLQNSSRIYFKASTSDRNQVELCILYDGKPKKRVEFDDDEDTTVNATDTDEVDKCRCTE